jgi:EAL domain-containing protein (putative c-di-GMP-specific phosphodiesterase class I)/ActR/RegA family two-component response regulator
MHEHTAAGLDEAARGARAEEGGALRDGAPEAGSSKRLLLVDDDEGIRLAYSRVLRSKGHQVTTAADGAEAIGRLAQGSFDVVVSDVAMPGMDGLEFLRRVREHDLDVPVILITGGPELAQAMRAVEYGAFRYLPKPIEADVLADVVGRAARMHQVARLKRQALALVESHGPPLGDRASLEARFELALKGLWSAFQPIVDWPARRVIGYEALLRTTETTLARPDHFIASAERLGRLHELTRLARAAVAAQAHLAPPDVTLFVNIHPADVGDDELFSPDAPLSRIADRVVLEITERSSLDGVSDLRPRIAALRKLGFRIAVDDLGAGYAGLTTVAQLEPEVVKIDMSLVRGISGAPTKQRVLRSIARLCEEMQIVTVAEGIETEEERETVFSLGCRLLQGYLFARPEKGFQPVSL